MRVRSLDQEGPQEKEVAAHSSILAWNILWTEEPGGSIGSERVGYDWVTEHAHTVKELWRARGVHGHSVQVAGWGTGRANGRGREEEEEEEAVWEKGQKRHGLGQAARGVPVEYPRGQASSWRHGSDSEE